MEKVIFARNGFVETKHRSKCDLRLTADNLTRLLAIDR